MVVLDIFLDLALVSLRIRALWRWSPPVGTTGLCGCSVSGLQWEQHITLTLPPSLSLSFPPFFHPSIQVIAGPVAGGCEDDKHTDPGHAAVLELEEEAHLIGGKWYSLLEEGGREGGREGEVRGAPADKYSSTFFNFYLVVDPEREEEARVRARDEEELLVVHRGVGEGEVRRLIREGRMTVPAACASLLALEKLRELGLLKPKGGREGGRERAGREEEKKKKEAWMATVRGGGKGGRAGRGRGSRGGGRKVFVSGRDGKRETSVVCRDEGREGGREGGGAGGGGGRGGGGGGGSGGRFCFPE